MYSKSDILEIMINDEEDKVENRYRDNLESMKGSEFVFHYVYLLCYNCPKINQNRGGSYIDSPDWIKNKKSNNKLHQQKR